ncbi:dolichol kinase ASCRUDRAFT_18517, partial [Ascoidea rubescens DSM 1968]
LTWLYYYIFTNKVRVKILFYWVTLTILSIPFIMFIIYKMNLLSLNNNNNNNNNDNDNGNEKTKSLTSSSLNFKRKIWHFLIFLIIIPTYNIDVNFIKIALSGMIIIFIILELLRIVKLPPYGEFLNDLLYNFTDYRDRKGPVIISYIFLLIGVSLPLYLDNSISGIITLSIGDSFASLAGKKFGEIKWFNSNKTVEGTISYIFSCFFVLVLLKQCNLVSELQDKSINCLFLSATLSGLAEAISDLNDNILTPAIMFIVQKVV